MGTRAKVERAYGWACDFETNNHEDDCRVWCWAIENIMTGEKKRGTTIQQFIVTVSEQKEQDFYFNNLKFDGGFIIDYLLNHGYKHTEERYPGRFEFGTLITEMGNFYTISMRNKRFIDALKILVASVEEMPKMFGLESTKGSIDYDAYRAPGYKPTDKEWDYVERDVHILAGALRYMFERGQRKITAASNAFNDLHQRMGEKWSRLFPKVDRDIDTILRKGYRGGYCIVGPAAKNGDVGEGIVYDENSMYPDKMRNALLPYGSPMVYEGEYDRDPMFPLYVQVFRCKFHVKQDYLPTIQIKHGFRFAPTEYLADSGDELVELVLTSVDLEIFFEHYDVWCYEPLYGFKFMATRSIFEEFVDFWYEIKQNAGKDNPGMRTLAKRMLNSSYGKFGKRGEGAKKIPYLGEDGVVHYKTGETEEMRLEYLPVAMFITAWARDDVIRKGQANYERLCYIDTDSLHFVGTETPDNVRVHPSDLGAWKEEYRFTRARYLRAKTYIEETETEGLVVKCAGMSTECKRQVNWDNFRAGAEFEGKLVHKTVKGGVVLRPTTFEIKV